MKLLITSIFLLFLTLFHPIGDVQTETLEADAESHAFTPCNDMSFEDRNNVIAHAQCWLDYTVDDGQIVHTKDCGDSMYATITWCTFIYAHPTCSDEVTNKVSSYMRGRVFGGKARARKLVCT